MLRWLAGAEISEVYALGAALIRDTHAARGLTDTVVLTLRFENGALAVIDNCWQAVYGYDVRNRLTSKQTPFGTLSYTYNEAGSLLTTRSSNANGVSVDYSYDTLNRLSSVKDNNLTALNGGVSSYTYDAVGNLLSISRQGTNQLAIGLALVTVLVTVSGLLLAFTGLILHAVINANRRTP